MGNYEQRENAKGGAEDRPGREYAYWLCCVPGIGNRTIAKLLESCGTPEEIYKGGEKLWGRFLTERQREAFLRARKASDPLGAYEKLREQGIRFALREDAVYPERLRQISDAPFALFYRGELPEEHALSVAVIGARECSEYGRFVAVELGHALGRYGVQVVSGMARGIDGICQQAALEAGGTSFAVLGSGVDVCYPKENRMIYDRLRAQGGVLSIYPPGTEARPQNFPPRNRIVSGLADMLVVIEARCKSGTLITVDMALEQGKDVYVVPGRVTDRLSDGCNRLLKQGAGVFLSPEDFLEEAEAAWLVKREKSGEAKREAAGQSQAGRNRAEEGERRSKTMEIGSAVRTKQLPEELRRVFSVLEPQSKSLEEISGQLSGEYSTRQLTVILMRLCMEGAAAQLTPGYFVRR